jgi:alginate O-acetyltransferase complex protein AlgI
MGFHSVLFLISFLPASLALYLLAAPRYRNALLLAASLAFYAWAQWFTLPLLLALTVLNFALARRIERLRGLAEEGQPPPARGALLLGVAANVAVLVLFKLLSGYGEQWFAGALSPGAAGWLTNYALPLGLSYVSFQLISYLVDVYNEMCDSEKNFWNFAQYVFLFPKIVTGPIAKYRDLAGALSQREVSSEDVAVGLRRFALGLAKKVLIADTIGRVTTPAFALDAPVYTTGIAWVVVLGYAIQLYFDFSGYIDMALGLGRMFGFRLPENFNYPYIARSIGDFWRRWHITLSTWFREYVFYPLEFTRRREDRMRQQVHVLVVFLLTGLWHGLTVNFAIWGLIHGAAIALEMRWLGRWLKKAWAPLQHFYTLAVVLLGWVFFRSPDLPYALALLGRLFGSQQGVQPLVFSQSMPLPLIENSVWAALALGALLSLPVFPAVQAGWQRLLARVPGAAGPARAGADLLLLALLVVAFTSIVGNAYVGSIYGGF